MSALSSLASLGLFVALGTGLAFAPVFVSSAQAQATTQQTGGAVDAARVAALTDTMMIADIMGVMREEGLDYGKTLAAEMFPGQATAQWETVVSLIYDPQTMRERFDAGLTKALSGAGAEIDAIEAFFGSEQGQTVLRLEIEARRALLDDDVEDAAKLSWEEVQAEGGPRVDRLNRFVEANDLIESNVMGALNANLAFYRGLSESGGFPQEMTEDQMLSDVWSQEADVRSETTDWLFPFLSLAYQPLSDEDLDAYIAFSEGPAGQTLNAALFAAYDAVFTQISQDLGRAAARQMLGEDI